MAENETTRKHVLLSDEEIGTIVKQSVQEGIHEGLLRVGLDTTDPIQLQRDFQFVRDVRRTADAIRSKAILTTIGMIIAGAVAVIWIGIRTILKTP